MSRKNRFGFESIGDVPVGVSRRRGSGPMSTAVRETAESLTESTEAKVEARQKNAADARAYRDAMADGLVLARIPLGDILIDDLPRDRLDLDGVAVSDEMDELKASIRAHGQKEPIEVYHDGAGRLQLKKGWRRLTALRSLHAETGEDFFATALARVDGSPSDRLRHYVDMVEENILRQDLTFAEMAQVAVDAAADPRVDGTDADAMVNRLYASLHKTKRSYIRGFVGLMQALGPHLPYPKSVNRDLGLATARAMKDHPDLLGLLVQDLTGCTTAADQNAVLQTACDLRGEVASRPLGEARPTPRADTRQKYEFHIGPAKVTARRGEFRIKDDTDFTGVPRERLEEAVKAFQAVLRRL